LDTLHAELHATRGLLPNQQGGGGDQRDSYCGFSLGRCGCGMVSVDDKERFDHYLGQRELLVSKPTTLGDVFSLARATEVRMDDQAVPMASTSAG
ncbi:hypothetical protein Tco_1519695, partial [Tanacetum coccineum]